MHSHVLDDASRSHPVMNAARSVEVSGRLLLRAMPKIEIADMSSATIVATGSIHPGVPQPSARPSTRP
jgi:hypothetical protein